MGCLVDREPLGEPQYRWIRLTIWRDITTNG